MYTRAVVDKDTMIALRNVFANCSLRRATSKYQPVYLYHAKCLDSKIVHCNRRNLV